ncbi:MAG: hypothetical protein HC904_16210 [Blastochloris sp.]|nr:hypothetical protein [Blastochloris sp.]
MKNLNDGSLKISGSLDSFSSESEAWRVESQAWMKRVDSILELDLWVWVTEVSERSWESMWKSQEAVPGDSQP